MVGQRTWGVQVLTRTGLVASKGEVKSRTVEAPVECAASMFLFIGRFIVFSWPLLCRREACRGMVHMQMGLSLRKKRNDDTAAP